VGIAASVTQAVKLDTAWTPVGRTSLRIPRLGLGTVPLGDVMGPIGEDESEAIVRRAYDLGVRLYDTAPQYGSGRAERRLGIGMAGLPRGEVIVATKVGRLLRRTSTGRKIARVARQAIAGPDRGISLIRRNAAGVIARASGRDHTFPLGYPFERGERALEPYFDFSYDGVMRSVERSLARLHLDRVDMLYIHDPDDHFEAAKLGAYRALDRLRSDGSVSAIGVGMNQSAMLARFAREAPFDVFLLAGRYTLLDQSGARDLMPICQEKGITVIVGGVFNSGILADPRPGSSFDYQPADADSPALRRALHLKAICDRYEVPLAAAALQFPLAHPAVGAVLGGVRSVAELESNVALFQWPIPTDLWREIRAEGLVVTDAPLPGEASGAGS
jgi:D-threo-aldose 1-dehydrogenase